MGFIMAALAVLLLPVLLAVLGLLALIFYLFVALPLCPRLSNAASGSISTCANCPTGFCFLAVGLTLFIFLPLALAAFLIRRKRSRLP